MDFLKKALHIKIRNDDSAQKYSLPNYLLSRYSVRSAYFDKQRVFLLYPKSELDQVSTIKKHIQKLQGFDKIPVVLVLSRITARQRLGMIEGGIPFIVENKQCYLPFLGTVLTERCGVVAEPVEMLSPSAQMLLFYYIYHNQKELFSNAVVEVLGVSAMTVTRAVRQLEQAGLIRTYKSGVMKIITSDFSREELFENAKVYLSSPIKRTVYVPKNTIDDSLLVAGDQALSMMSMLNPPRVGCYATSDSIKWKQYSDSFIDEENQLELQIWKYDPRVLTTEGCVDVLSLAMCYVDDMDERVEEAIEEMLEVYWRKTNG